MLCLRFFPLPEDKQRKVGFLLLQTLSDLNISLLMPGKTPRWTDMITRIYLTEGKREENLPLLLVLTSPSLSQWLLYLPPASFYTSWLALLGQRISKILVSGTLILTWFWVRCVPVTGIPLQLDLLQCEYGDVCQTWNTVSAPQIT